MPENYETWTRKKLIEHIRAYANSLHELSGVAMKQIAEIHQLKKRIAGIDGVRGLIHGA